MSPDYVVKRSGERQEVDPAKIERVCIWATQGLDIDYRDVYSEQKIKQFVYSGIKTSTIQELLAHQFAALTQNHEHYGIAGARFILQKIRKEINSDGEEGAIDYPHLEKFLNNLMNYAVIKFNPELLTAFDIDQLNAAIKPGNDLNFGWMAIQTLYDRYLVKNKQGNVIEGPQHFFMRVAMGLALCEETKEKRTKVAIDFYNAYSNLDVLSSTPTLFNSATLHSQLSSCFVSRVENDSLTGIFSTGQENALYSKYSGGTAISMTPIRAKGCSIKSTGGISSGIVPFAKLYEQIMRGFDQGGKRPGVTCLYLEPWHKDIFSFLKSVDSGQDERFALRDVNIAVWVNDLFMKRKDSDENWSLFSPSDVPELHELWGNAFEQAYVKAEQDPSIPRETVKAKDIWKEMLKTLFNRKGKGWITFKDECNRRSPTRNFGVVHSSNLCTEITLRNSDTETSVCNLASINLANVDSVEKLEKAVRTSVRMVDNAVTLGYLPHERAKKFNENDRPLGIGVMGYTMWLINNLGIDYESYSHLVAADILFSLINYYAIDESANLAREKGAFPNFDKSRWAVGELTCDTAHVEAVKLTEDAYTKAINENAFSNSKLMDYVNASSKLDWDKLREKVKGGLRNSNLLAIAPTATIANIAGVTNCIELPYKNLYSKDNETGQFTIVSPIYSKYKGTDKQYLIKDAFCDQHWSVMAAAIRQKWIDQSQSLNIFVRNSISGKQLSSIYDLAHRLGVKTTYYLRSEAEDFENDSTENLSVCSIDNPDCEACQ